MNNYKWYTYIFTIVLVLAAQMVGLIPFVLYENGNGQEQSALSLGMMLIAMVTSMAALFLCVKFIHRDKIKNLFTERKKFDWKRVGLGAGLWLLLSIIYTLISLTTSPEEQIINTFNVPQFLSLALISVVLLPFQTTFEELFFRGYLFQAISRLSNLPWLAALLIAVLFAVMHLSNPEIATYGMGVMLVQYLVLSFTLGLIAWIDKGIEITIGMHYINNLYCLLLVSSEGSVFTTPGSIFKVVNEQNTYLDAGIMALLGAIFILIFIKSYKVKLNITNKNL